MPVVAHHEVHAGRNNQIAVDDMVGKIDGPAFGGAAWLRIGRNRGKLVEKLLVVFRRCGLRVRLRLWSHSVEDHDAIAKMDMVAGYANQPFDQEEVLRLAVSIQFRLGNGLDKDDDVAALRLTVVNQWHPLGGGASVMRSTTR